MVEFDVEKMTEQDLLEAANKIFTVEEKDFEKIKSEKWYQTLFHAITLNQDGKKYAVRGINSLNKLQQLFMGIYVKNYRKSHEQLDMVIDKVVKNSEAIKRLYGMCVLELEEQESLEALDSYDAEILALFLGEYRDMNNQVPDKVRDYNRGVLGALNRKMPIGALDNHQIRKLKAPKVVYRCFMEQCAVDGTIDTQEWSNKIYEDLRDFELSENSKTEITELVKHEEEVAGVEYFIVKYTKENGGVLDTDFVVELGEGRYVSPKEQEQAKMKEKLDLVSLSMTATQFMMNLSLGTHSFAFISAFSDELLVSLDILDGKEMLNDDEFNSIPLNVLKKSVKTSLEKDNGCVGGYKLSTMDDNCDSHGHYFVILTTEYFFIFINDRIAVMPISTLQSVKESSSGLEINAWNIKWYDKTGTAINGSNETIIVERNKINTHYIKPLRKGFESFIEKYSGYISSPDDEVEKIIGEYIKKIAKSYTQTYMVKDFKYDDNKSKKKLKNALSKYALKVQEKDVVGFIDSSLLQNGGAGLLFSNHGIAFDSAFEKIFIHYDEISKMDFNKKGTEVNFHGHFSERKDDSTIPSIHSIYFDVRELEKCIKEIQYAI